MSQGNDVNRELALFPCKLTTELSGILMSAGVTCYMIISDRIHELSLLAEEEGSIIDPISLSTFLNFTELISEHVRNNLVISLTPDNEIYATWEGSKKHCLRFMADGMIKYFSR